ncbi:unnamed protein product [Amoebophrya sp. A25]|nr:unnamed protein product [Amoebophrya sp. A25]|eukprot:GSA25T00027048001.1
MKMDLRSLIGHVQRPLNVTSFLVSNLIEPLNNADLFLVSPRPDLILDGFVKNGHECVEEVEEGSSASGSSSTWWEGQGVSLIPPMEGERDRLWAQTRKYHCSQEVVRLETTKEGDFFGKEGPGGEEQEARRTSSSKTFRIFTLESITTAHTLLDFFHRFTGGGFRKVFEASLGRIMYGWRPEKARERLYPVGGPRGHMSILGGLPLPPGRCI